MSRWIFWFSVSLVSFGFLLHAEVSLPDWLYWLGHLPGDGVLQRGTLTLYLPFTTAFLSSLCLTALFSGEERR